MFDFYEIKKGTTSFKLSLSLPRTYAFASTTKDFVRTKENKIEPAGVARRSMIICEQNRKQRNLEEKWIDKKLGGVSK